ncbi:MAG TPA: BON domain-containing protein [Wenzhouxiangella sp.]|nr:BON domain-containing protein [Wenzhouxiangella sp.]
MNRTVRLMTAFFMLAGLVGLGIQSATAADAGQDSSDSDRAMSDTWITTKVKAELATTRNVSSTRISVNTKDGTVALTGVVSTDDEVERAVAAAEGVKGVKEVDASGLKVRAEEDDESRTVGEAVDDTWITTKVKAELASTEDLASSGISVTTEDGTVTLSGTVDNNVAKKKAVAAAESVKGVKKVKSSDLETAQ